MAFIFYFGGLGYASLESPFPYSPSDINRLRVKHFYNAIHTD